MSLQAVMSKKANRLLMLGAALVLVVSSMAPFLRASAIENGGAYAEIFMRGATDVAISGTDITFAYEGGTVAVEGATDPVVDLDENWNFGDHVGSLYKFYTKSDSLVFTPTAENGNGIRIFSGADGQNEEVSLTDGHYTLGNLVTKGNSGPTYDVEFQFNGGALQPPQPQPGNTSATIDYTYSGPVGVDFRLNGQFIDMESQQFDDNHHVNFVTDYNTEQGDTTVNFTAEVLWIYVMDGLTINGVSPELPDTAEELMAAYNGYQRVEVNFVVPISDTYTITSHTHDADGEEIFMGNFLWNNDENAAGFDDDDVIGHGTLEFVKATYQGVTYNSVAELNAASNVFSFEEDPQTGVGSATFPVGTELTVRLLPEAGYQLTSFGINGGAFEPQENVGEYTFTIRPGNGHFAANFEAIEDAVTAGAEAVESGSIELADGELDYGTAVLEVEEADLDDEDIAGFEDAAGDYTVSTYLDISLYQVTYKGTNNANDAWKDQLNNLNGEATITLQLEEGVDGNEIVIVHQKHDGTYEVIPTIYDPVANTITFKTSSFSNYAIASRTTDAAATPNTGAVTTSGSSARLVLSGALIITTAVVLSLAIAIRKKESQEQQN